MQNFKMSSVEVFVEENKPETSYKFWRRLTQLERVLSIGLLLCLVFVLSLICAVIIITTQPEKIENSTNDFDMCKSEECFDAAATIVNNMDLEADPCTDFYLFACGNWKEKEILGYDNVIRSMYEYLVKDDPVNLPAFQKAQMYYNVCIEESNKLNRSENEEDVTSFKEFVDAYTEDGEQPNFSVLLGNIRKDLEVVYLLSLSVILDPFNTSRHALYISAPDDEQLKDVNLTERREMFTKISNLLYPLENIDIIPSLIDFETHLANMSSTEALSMKQHECQYYQSTVGELQNALGPDSTIQLSEYLTKVFSESVEDGESRLTFDETTPIILNSVFSMTYFKSLGMLLNVTSPDVLVNYLKWRVASDFIQDSNISHLINTTTEDDTSVDESWYVCTKNTYNLFREVLNQEYWYGYETKTSILESLNEMTKEIKKAFRARIISVDWIGRKTKLATLLKLRVMNTQYGYAPNLDHLIKYDELKFTNDKNYFQMLLDIAKWSSLQQLKLLNTAPDQSEWLTDPFEEDNAFHHYEYNTISIPQIHLMNKIKIFESSIPAFIRYSTVGCWISHEILHGFDNTGRRFNFKGNLRNWWDDKSNETFESKADCYRKQYSSYNVEELDDHPAINGDQTLDENIADNEGLHMVFQAYKNYLQTEQRKDFILPGLKQYSPDQMFFLTYAQDWCAKDTEEHMREILQSDGHALNRYRVKGTLENSEEFSKAWSCPKNENICQIY